VLDRCIVVLDVGKTHAKLTLWAPDGSLIARRLRANAVISTGDYRTLDVVGIEAWVAEVLSEFASLGRVGAIVPVGHGAAAALILDGRLVYPPMDYESPIPPAVRSLYDAERDSFSNTGSPALPEGLNLGVQLFWLEQLVPATREAATTILPWAQYWAWVFSGVAASEQTSLGCHTDLWCPAKAQPSALAEARGWAERLAPLRRADAILGELRPEWVRRTGLPKDTQVLCGLHDSNAALLAARGFNEIADRESTVISTGTWFVAMRSPSVLDKSLAARLPESRDCLMNVDAYGKLIPSARFMGGRELELMTAPAGRRIDDPPAQTAMLAAAGDIVASGTMALPTLTPGFGPYPDSVHRWRCKPSHPDGFLAASGLYAALVMDTSLSLIGARETILVEGRFAEADIFVQALAALRPTDTTYTSHADNGVAYGALRLILPEAAPPMGLMRVPPLATDLSNYASSWRKHAEQAR
jgi:sugar (pentulose or hexulose) kinase